MRNLLLICTLLISSSIEAYAQYYFIFKARGPGELYRDSKGKMVPSRAGHAFVSLVRRDEIIGQTVVDSTWGFTRAEGTNDILSLISVSGTVESTTTGDLGSSDFVIETDKATYDYAKNLKSKWVAKKYGVFKNVNCVDFARAMLELVTPELKIPGTATEADFHKLALVKLWYKNPKPFINEVKQLNTKRDEESRASLSKTPSITEPPIRTSSNTRNSSPAPTVEPKPQSTGSATVYKNLLGGSTPAELGMLIINSLKNNDRKTYIRCINPNVTEDSYNDMTEDFEQLRTWFEDHGVITWKDVEFSRIRCQTRVDGNVKVAAFFHVEFTYKKFLGALSLGSARSIPGGDKYLLTGGFAKSHSQFYPSGAWGGR